MNPKLMPALLGLAIVTGFFHPSKAAAVVSPIHYWTYSPDSTTMDTVTVLVKDQLRRTYTPKTVMALYKHINWVWKNGAMAPSPIDTAAYHYRWYTFSDTGEIFNRKILIDNQIHHGVPLETHRLVGILAPAEKYFGAPDYTKLSHYLVYSLLQPIPVTSGLFSFQDEWRAATNRPVYTMLYFCVPCWKKTVPGGVEYVPVDTLTHYCIYQLNETAPNLKIHVADQLRVDTRTYHQTNEYLLVPTAKLSVSVPAMSPVGMLLICLLLVGTGLLVLSRQRRAAKIHTASP